MTYPKWWDKTVTIYNRHEDNTGRVEWYKTIIKGCFVKTLPTLTIMQGVGTVKTQNTVRIRKSADFLPPLEWQLYTYKNRKFTLQNGDIIVIGPIFDNVDEYISWQRSSDLLKKYSNSAFVICSVGINDYGIRPHYKITG